MKLAFCVACGSKKGLEHHHLIPRSRGGSNAETNMITLCRKHHLALHEMHGGNANHSKLVEEGIARAIASGVKIGRIPKDLDQFIAPTNPEDVVLLQLHCVEKLRPYLIQNLRWIDIKDGGCPLPNSLRHTFSNETNKAIKKACFDLQLDDISMSRLVVSQRYNLRKNSGTIPKCNAITKRIERLRIPK